MPFDTIPHTLSHSPLSEFAAGNATGATRESITIILVIREVTTSRLQKKLDVTREETLCPLTTQY